MSSLTGKAFTCTMNGVSRTCKIVSEGAGRPRPEEDDRAPLEQTSAAPKAFSCSHLTCFHGSLEYLPFVGNLDRAVFV
jgi:hypothetical protein